MLAAHSGRFLDRANTSSKEAKTELSTCFSHMTSVTFIDAGSMFSYIYFHILMIYPVQSRRFFRLETKVGNVLCNDC